MVVIEYEMPVKEVIERKPLGLRMVVVDPTPPKGQPKGRGSK